LNKSIRSGNTFENQLCSACGLCCNGVIFANVALRPDDNAERLRSSGLPVCAPHSAHRPAHVAQPCAAFDGCHCRVYADRPEYCRAFDCALLKRVKAGQTESAAAVHVIQNARARADQVRRLLHTLGDTDEQLPLSARFRRTGKRLREDTPSGKDADIYAQLTLAFHDLNLLLSDAFYPGSTRHGSKSGALRTGIALICAAQVLFAGAGLLQADQVELQNGDRFVGQVLTLNSNTVVLQSEVLGTLRLPRHKVAVITLGAGSVTTSPALPLPTNSPVRPPSALPTKSATNLSPAFRQLGASTNLIQQVQKQFLSGAGPEANNKFNELLGGLMSGKLSVEDIRAEAKTAVDQLRALQRESGEESGFANDAYLAILDHFLKETAPLGSATNSPAALPKLKPESDEEEK
jgi:uncharacterized protein